MASRIEDYALLADGATAALVSREGSVDWLCAPRFDSGACFAALLGDREHGRFAIGPADEGARTSRRYRHDSLVLETTHATASGEVLVIDAMPPRSAIEEHGPVLARVVIGVRGTVRMRCDLVIRFEYGSTVPWVRRSETGLVALAGPDRLRVVTPVALGGEGFTSQAEFDVRAGERVPFVLAWSGSFGEPPPPPDALAAIERTDEHWRSWAGRGDVEGPWRDVVMRSLITLKALTYVRTGGIVAAPTTSLPERIGGRRNWDYRYCWLRDATFSLYALMSHGYHEEASAWRDWLVRAVAGRPHEAHILYGVGAERRIRERELDWLPGYEGSRPVRVGNSASEQRQLDVYGEVLDALHQARRLGLPPDRETWRIERALVDEVCRTWAEPDEGIWEVRGPRRDFTFSKVMAWVAVDRAIQSAKRFGLEGEVARWRSVRRQIHADVCRRGWNEAKRSFVQSYGGDVLDASLLLIPQVGFLRPDDPRVLGTIAAVERELLEHGLVRRYPTEQVDDGLPSGEAFFLACSFWLADAYVLAGRVDEARAMFERLVGLTNDVGLLAEEYDPGAGRQLGNFPQALSHIALIDTARNLTHAEGPAKHRRDGRRGRAREARGDDERDEHRSISTGRARGRAR